MIGTYKTKLDQLKGAIKERENKLCAKQTAHVVLKQDVVDAEEAQAFISKIAQDTQGQLKVHIEDIVSMAIATILDDPYSFELDFVNRNNRIECDLWFNRNGSRINPIDASGGGAVDIASFACRIALWSLGTTDNVLVFDEPFRFVSREYQPLLGELLSKLSTQLNLQIIQVTHNPSLVENSDTVITVSKNKDEWATSKISKEK